MEKIFNSADKKFGSDVMYNEIKNLTILHSAQEALPEISELGKKTSEEYGVNDKQGDFFATTTLKTIIDISKENISAAKTLVKNINNEGVKESLQVVLKKAGMAYEIDFSDVIALKAK